MRQDSVLTERWSSKVLLAVLALTALTVLAWGHFKLLDQDEVFVLQTDSVTSVRQLVAVQRHTPISLDPLFYHLLGHASVRLLGPTALALRLPSLLGFLLMQVCLFAMARRIAGPAAGVVAAAFPALSATLYYGVEARPYGVLLGLSALTLWSWQSAVREKDGSRATPLLLLAAALALALNTHYFAILLLIPLCAAELYRSARRRRVDWPVVAALIAGMAGEVLTLPFQKAAGEFRRNYYNAGQVGLHAVSQAYRALIVNYTDAPLPVQRAIAGVLVLAAAALLLAVVWRLRSRSVSLACGEGVLLSVLALLPFFGFLLARFVTHSIEVRYVLPAVLALSILLAIAVQPLLRRRAGVTTGVLLALLAVAGAARVRGESTRRSEALAAAAIGREVRERLAADPTLRLFVQNVGHFEEAEPYLADAALRSRVVLLYSNGEELRWLHHDTGALTAEHLRAFSSVPVASFDALQRQGGGALVVLYPPSGWDWLGAALQDASLPLLPVGPALGGQAVEVRFP